MPISEGAKAVLETAADVTMQVAGTNVPGGAGAVTAATPRVTLGSDDPAVASLGVVDDWDESDRAKVNLIASQAGITGGAGAVAANTPRTTLASDDPAVTAVQIMDDWDESDRAKVNPIAGQAGVAAGAGAIAATVQRVTVATDDTVATDLTAIKTATQLIDDSVFTDDTTTFTPATTKGLLIGAVVDDTGTDSADEGDLVALRASADRVIYQRPHPVSAASLSNVNDTASSTTLLAANASRKGAIVHNDSTSILYLKYGATASTTSYTVKIAADGYWEMPQPIYTGIIDGIWSSDASGAARITEL